MDWRPARLADLRFIFGNLDRRMVREYQMAIEVMNGGRPQTADKALYEVKREFKSAIKAGNADCIFGTETPLAVMGWFVEDRVVNTMFAGTPEFFRPISVRFGRAYIREFQVRQGNLAIKSVNWSSRSDYHRPRVRKWFESLGFTTTLEEDHHVTFTLVPSGEGVADVVAEESDDA